MDCEKVPESRLSMTPDLGESEVEKKERKGGRGKRSKQEEPPSWGPLIDRVNCRSSVEYELMKG